MALLKDANFNRAWVYRSAGAVVSVEATLRNMITAVARYEGASSEVAEEPALSSTQ